MGEYEKVEALKNEYNNLVDSNGKIKEGYEDRADYIKGELAEALGLEKSEIDELIDKNGKLKGAIDDVILSQKAQAILEADQDAYTQAMENKAKAAEKLGPAMDTLNKKQKELDEAEKEYKALLADYNAQDSKTKATKAWTDKMAEAKDKVDSLRGKVAEADAAVSKYSGTLEQSQAEIDRHEGFVKALADKDKGAIAQWIADYERGLKSRANATDKELQAQYKTEKKYLDDMIKARKSGDKRITDELLKQQEDRVKFAQQEAEAVTKAAAKEGQGVNKELQGAAKKILGIFPVKVGKAVSGSFSLPDIWAKVKEIGKGVAKAVFPQFFSSVKTKYFAAGYENPKLFTNPSVYGGAVFGDKGTSRGGELVYGRENLLKDIASVSGGTTINVTVNGAESPEAWADRFVQEYQLQTRTV
jgi:hypothetical protein